jgi:putative endonuclease
MWQPYTYYVYIVKCYDGFYYTGITNDLDRRLEEHNKGYDVRWFTFSRRPVELMYSKMLNDVNQAIQWEKQIKDWGRKKKEALFKEDWKALIDLSKNSAVKANLNNPSTSSG